MRVIVDKGIRKPIANAVLVSRIQNIRRELDDILANLVAVGDDEDDHEEKTHFFDEEATHRKTTGGKLVRPIFGGKGVPKIDATEKHHVVDTVPDMVDVFKRKQRKKRKRLPIPELPNIDMIYEHLSEYRANVGQGERTMAIEIEIEYKDDGEYVVQTHGSVASIVGAMLKHVNRTVE